MIAAVLVFGVGGLIASPHLIARRSLPAVVGTIIWFSALLGRAGVVVTICVGLVAIAPDTRVFAEASDWFVHSVLPFALHSLGIEGDTLGHLATSVPFAAVLGMAIAAAYGSWRSHRLVGRWLDRACLGPGPSGCHIVGGSRVVFATAGVLRPRVIVSMGALMSLEDRELRAGIEHEHAHARRGHGLIVAAGNVLAAMAKPLPGTTSALAGLRYSLERDADEHAVRSTGNRLDLADAIRATSHCRPSGAFCSNIGNRLKELSTAQGDRGAANWTAILLVLALSASAAAVVLVLARVLGG